MTRTPRVEVSPPPDQFDLTCPTLIIGAGACGLVAALAAHEAGQQVLVVEADPLPGGSTGLSAGLIPAPGTAIQQAAGIKDSARIFADDIQAKAKGENDQTLVDLLAQNAATVIDWLAVTHGLPFSLVTDFDYPGHSLRRMHGLPTRTGSELINALRSACEAQGIDIICERRAFALHQSAGRICGASVSAPDGTVESIGCDRLILACNGFGGNRALVAELTPQIRDALWFGHDGNRGEAVLWGRALNADLRHLGAYQGHGNVAHPHGILITWATMMEGGIQVNRAGRRFWNETQGYSEAARAVMGQPDGVAFAIFDSRIAAIARQFDDFRNAEATGAVQSADNLTDLADRLGLPAAALVETVDGCRLGGGMNLAGNLHRNLYAHLIAVCGSRGHCFTPRAVCAPMPWRGFWTAPAPRFPAFLPGAAPHAGYRAQGMQDTFQVMVCLARWCWAGLPDRHKENSHEHPPHPLSGTHAHPRADQPHAAKGPAGDQCGIQ